ncbi:ABC transporter permease [Nocardioides cavernaquae]|uniref:ABC transporter permease n=1 Tax=Nocardioides cavernaquae TaxID=2321396 RepID=A0A3A5HJF2_9ACTN|nr:ABC transporter permease [Nocardioides cavernaquae]
MIAAILASGLGFAIPLLVAATGELVSERAGVLNMSLEGMMLTGAFSSVIGAVESGSAVVGLFWGIAAGLALGMVQALASVVLRADQIVTGLALNALALAGTTFGARLLFTDRGAEVPGFDGLDLGAVGDLPVIGPALGQSVLAYVLVLSVAVVAVITSRRTSWGIAIDAAGEDAVRADWAGVPVNRVRFASVLLAGALAGAAGAQLALSEVHTFTDNMTAGAGYLAVVAVIAGRWRALPTVVATLAFGVAQALQYSLPAVGVDVPTGLLLMLPYAIALLATAGLVASSRAPSALTRPFARSATGR